ncbi:MAG TPA: polyprenyl synthetase family protein [Polyangiaceae bacterium]|jgi:geranylgeranyl pyrophosphate synthase|nr:polyprenyl synthetase family protein [Polyangiaceae bacterium]
MTQSAAALETDEPLAAMLDREFEHRSLAALGNGAAARVPWHLWSKALYVPLRDFLNRPGKAMRSELVGATYRLAGGKGSPPPELSLFVEALHAGSLIIDDIEDDSEERRGLPALHRLYGVPAALNGGSWLYFWAFELLERVPMTLDVRAAAQRTVTCSLRECHYGQALDLSIRLEELEPREVLGTVQTISELKTGGLVALSTALGALVAGADPSVVDAATRFGREVGVALQMLDDLSSITSDRRRQKGHEDLTQGKPTWPWAWLSTELDARAFATLSASLGEVASGASPEPLRRVLRNLVSSIGRDRVREHLDRAVARLGQSFPSTSLAPLRHQLERLERCYGPTT